MRIQARVVDRKLEPRFLELMEEHNYYQAARHAFALAVSHRVRRNYKIARHWGKICLQLLSACSENDWVNDKSSITLGGIDVPAPLYQQLAKDNLWWLLTAKNGKPL
ncbi:MAG: hypothetical protein HZC05_03810 [Candidatus Magasanikbacteria bacterium]|nr:hypothetical protein [Candidatus Magasanikbacteria bacterium]